MTEVRIDPDVLEYAWMALGDHGGSDTYYAYVNRSALEDAIVEAFRRSGVDPRAAMESAAADARYRQGLNDGYARAARDAAMLSDRVTDSRLYLKDALEQLDQARKLLAKLDATTHVRHSFGTPGMKP